MQTLTDKIALSGVKKVHLLQNHPGHYFLRSMLAGMYLSVIVLVYWSLYTNIHAHDIAKLLASAFFGTGLAIISFTHSELFTSNCMYLTISSLKGRTTWGQTLRLWLVCYLGNLFGALFFTALLVGAGITQALPETHAIYSGAASKINQAESIIFFKGILANWVVCLAIWLTFNLKDDVTKFLSLLFVVFIFLYLGFEHSIANLGTFSIVLAHSDAITLSAATYSLIFCTLGNIVGGALLVGFPYYFLNENKTHKADTEDLFIHD